MRKTKRNAEHLQTFNLDTNAKDVRWKLLLVSLNASFIYPQKEISLINRKAVKKFYT